VKKLIIGIAIGAVLAGTTAALASIPDSNGTIHACRNTKDGSVRVIDSDAGQTCGKDEAALNWNQTGPQGPAGIQGPQGEPGSQGPAGAAGANGVSGYELVVNDIPFIGSQMQKFTANCPTGKSALGGSFAVSSGATWDPNLIGGHGVPVTELTSSSFSAWTQGSANFFETAHIVVSCAITS
jgi:hypothetical protein